MTRKRKESLVYGVGINDADYQVSTRDKNGKEWRCPFYKTWKNMLARCYSPAFQRNQPLYKGCSVDERWHRFSHFKSWMLEQDWEDKQLDKDMRFEGNQVYGPDTCQFLSRRDNVKAQKRAVFAIYKGFWVHLKSFYREDISAYTYAYKRVYYDRRMDLAEIEDERKQATQGVTVMWEGIETPLKSLCDLYSRDYEVIRDRLNSWAGGTVYSRVIYDENPYVSFELAGAGGVVYQFSNKNELVDYLGTINIRVDEYLPLCGGSLVVLKELIRDHKRTDTRTLYTIGEVTGYKEFWYRHYETTESRVTENMSKHNLPFVEAVQLPIQRIKRLVVNGETMLVKNMWQSYGLDAKLCNTIRSQKKLTFIQTLNIMGVPIQGLSIQPV
jgi:hypothetical protein